MAVPYRYAPLDHTEHATVTLCHTGTKDLASHLRRADIIVAVQASEGKASAVIEEHDRRGRRGGDRIGA